MGAKEAKDRSADLATVRSRAGRVREAFGEVRRLTRARIYRVTEA